MDNILTGVVIVPGATALLLLCVFTFLYQQTRDPGFRIWQLGWAAYCLHFVFLGLEYTLRPSPWFEWGADFTFVVMAWSIFRSTRVGKKPARMRPVDWGVLGAGAAWSTLDAATRVNGQHPIYVVGGWHLPYFSIEVGIAALMIYSLAMFYRHGQRRDSIGYRILAIALGFWSVLLMLVPMHRFIEESAPWLGHVLGPLPQLLVGIAMVIVLFENERRGVQENLLAFSTLDVERGRILPVEELVPAMEKFLSRLMGQVGAERAVFCMGSQWRGILPSVQRGFSAGWVASPEAGGMADFLSELALHRGGMAVFRDLDEAAPQVAEQGANFEHLRQVLQGEGVRGAAILGVSTRERRFGAVVFPQGDGQNFGASQLRLLTALGTQIGLTLENYVLMHDAQRRTKEYELLTQVGQVISAHLDPDEVMMAVQRELGQLFDTSNFYVAFLEGEKVRFELDLLAGVVQPKRTRPATNGLTEYIIRTGQPLLIRSDMEKARQRLGAAAQGKPARCMAGVPIIMYGRAVGMMAVLHHEREFVYTERDLEVLRTAAGQVAVAMENARLFAEEHRRARYLAFLNNVSKTAISSQDADQMLGEIVAEIQKNFQFDHIGIGILDYATKDIEIKAEAGTTARVLGRRVPLGSAIIGRVARSGEMALILGPGPERLASMLEDSKSVLCVPISYGDSALGVLNVESRREEAFGQQEVLILRTLADLLATALHNAFVFQKLQQQAITDGLTGIKTRRFFLEALQSEWKRGARSGRPFSVVLADLDKFKDVNDTMGHLEGDLVLARVGRLLEQKCRQSNVVARYGGDEFVILMPETGLDQAQVLSERLRLWIATDPMLNEHHITGSFGVATFPLHGATAEDVLRVADASMYVSKHGGGNRVATVEEFAELGSSHRQMVAAFIEGFLQREHVGPELCDELVQILRKLGAGATEENAEEALSEAVLMLTRAGETREMHAAGHGETVARIAETIGRALDLTHEEIKDLVFAGRVHDVGKILIPERILNKNGPLTADEYYLLKMHSTLGAQIVGTIPGGTRMQLFVRHHQENFDGSGYPGQLQGEQIPLGARILGVAEAYANMTLERPYAPAMSPEDAMKELEKFSGTQFDGLVVRTLAMAQRKERPLRQDA